MAIKGSAGSLASHAHPGKQKELTEQSQSLIIIQSPAPCFNIAQPQRTDNDQIHTVWAFNIQSGEWTRKWRACVSTMFGNFSEAELASDSRTKLSGPLSISEKKLFLLQSFLFGPPPLTPELLS
ncbi:uncharacterized protein UTRI_02358 [Ustilago trichophora]|uniref:Uncharacterized protein n=1 Tax=Ustilago trichophora TaxID=86804 RepID=A0A5C3E5U3_9BASI|nr:uncharacterized protein UTRI_02358 [Ustilago trichophora]